MKLLNLTNRYYIVIALVLLMVSSVFLAYRILYVVDNEISSHMLYEKLEIEKQLLYQKDIQNIHFIIGDRIEIQPLDSFTSYKVNIHDTTLYDLHEKKFVPYREISYQQAVGEKSYYIKLSRRLTENKPLALGLLVTLILVAIDIIICFYFLNRWFSSKVWQPFYRALSVLTNFDVQKGGIARFQRSKVDEFNTLNSELTKLTDKVARDYKNLREFTENMSHETQTPLAIIRSKLEVLLQSENLSQQQVQQMLSTLDSVNRLSKMNKGLIMLTRIENEQYAGVQDLKIGAILKKQIDDLDMFIASRELKTFTSIDESVIFRMNPHLAEILFTNLLSNAIKYNVDGGILTISLNKQKLIIANNGHPPTVPVEQIFERFKKGDQPDSVGLGLAIVKKIIDNSGATISYDYSGKMHTFTIVFPKEKITGKN